VSGVPCSWVDEDSGEPCPEKAVVGVGPDSDWVCMEHYETYLALVAANVKRAIEALSR
jgi:hypothetical protein